MGVIELQHVSKRYKMHRSRELLAHKAARRIGRAEGELMFEALHDVSFSIRPGERVAIVGGNGAGKSTLLSIIAGVAAPTEGSVRTEGRIGALLELGTGFHEDLTGRENIRVNASLLGLTAKKLAQQFDSIVDFAEVGEFLDEPLRTYSSGMAARLGFAVAIHVEPQILVLDEVMAVGDAKFQAKCRDRIDALVAGGVTLLFVSHAMEAVASICDRAIWLKQGRVVEDGEAATVIAMYAPTSGSRPAG
ncbi:MAG: ABC transporter ATP-binding protein [Acidobacteria bacterium]|nr:ABC transporter ATP-binding protein [Acidobacteriota bacterium]MDA1237275.1 ABC transporter ATP-binding protein [Acidobacteriota bacterium]